MCCSERKRRKAAAPTAANAIAPIVNRTAADRIDAQSTTAARRRSLVLDASRRDRQDAAEHAVTEPRGEPRLSDGTMIGPYRIDRRLGAGGMGEVYRAHDTRLGRDVAIKVLPPLFTADADRLVRFEREARLLASLNHPNIAAIYGIEEHGGMTGLV